MDSRRQAAQKRRLQMKSVSMDSAEPQAPAHLFPEPIQRRDSNQDEMHKFAKHVLGDYHIAVESMRAFGEPSRLLGIVDTAPSTPIHPPKQNPFDNQFRTVVSTSGSSESSSMPSIATNGRGGHLRHQVAEPPNLAVRGVSSTKKEKGQKHQKSSKGSSAQRTQMSKGGSTPSSGGSSSRNSNSQSAGESGSNSRPTNVLVVSRPKQGRVRPPKAVPPSPDLFKVDVPSGSVPSGSAHPTSVTTSTKTTSKTKKAQQSHSNSQQHVPLFESQLHSAHSKSGNATPTLTEHPKSKKTSTTQPVSSVSTMDTSSLSDTKVSLSLKKTNSMDQPAPRLTRDVRTGSIDIAQIQTLNLEPENINSYMSVNYPPAEDKSTKKKDKKLKKIKKRQKQNLTEEEVKDKPHPASSSHGLAGKPSNEMTSDGHVPTSMRQTTSVVPDPSSKLHKQRPSNLSFGSSNQIPVAEESVDSQEVQSMLEALKFPVKSLITPIPTPKKNKYFDFSTPNVPASNVARTLYSKLSETRSKPPPSKRAPSWALSGSDEESDGESKMAVATAVSTLDRDLETKLASQVSMTTHKGEETVAAKEPLLSYGSGSESSDSSSSSSDSSDSSDSEGEKTPNFDTLIPSSIDTITPIKMTPPHISGTLLSTISPLADEAANLSPPSHPSSVIPQQVPPMGHFSTKPEFQESNIMEMEISDSESSSGSDDSGSESDSESSDSEDQEDNEAATLQRNPLENHLMVSYGSDDLLPFGQGANSTGFLEGFNLEEMKQEPMSETSPKNNAFGFDTSTQPFDVLQQHTAPLQPKSEPVLRDVPQGAEVAREALSKGKKPSSRGSQDVKKSRFVSTFKEQPPQQQQEQEQQQQQQQLPGLAQQGSSGKKRKHEIGTFQVPPEFEPSAQKMPKTILKQPIKPSRRESILSISDDSDSSDSSSSSDEDGEDTAFTEVLPTSQPIATQGAVSQGEVAMQGLEATAQSNDTSLQVQQPQRGPQPGVSFVVRIPLVLARDQQKPKAKVEPYQVEPYHATAPNKTLRKRVTSEATDHEEPHVMSRHDSLERDSYGRHREDIDHPSEYSHDYHRPYDGDRRRPPRDGRAWESSRDRRIRSSSDDPPRGSSRHGGRGDRGNDYRERDRGTWDRERERDYHSHRENWYYREYDDGRRRPYHPDRTHNADYHFQEARRRKRDADKIRAPGLEKAKAYMESIVYFMRHGDAIEHETQQQWETGPKKNPFKMYLDTVTMIRLCEKMSGDCKPLIAMCMRCQSVLYWRLYVLKQATASQIQKDLQDFFIPQKSGQKSPYPNSFSPLPSPASVGSTTSTGSGMGGVAIDPSPAPSTSISVPRVIFNKATEHLTISTNINQSFELWKHSDVMIEQCRDFFAPVDRKVGRISQFSPISQVADWTDLGLRNLRWI